MNKYLISVLLLNSALLAASRLDVSIPDPIRLTGLILAFALMVIGLVKSKK